MRILFSWLLLCACLIGCCEDRTGKHVPPNPAPVPAPVVDEHVKVLLVENTADRIKLPNKQAAIFNHPDIQAWCEQHCSKTNGRADYLRLDVADDVSTLDTDFQAGFNSAKTQKMPVLCVFVKGSWHIGELPQDKDQVLAVLAKMGNK